MVMPIPPAGVVRYGEATLSDLLPSALAALTGTGPNPLELPAARTVVVLLIDGLGWNLLQRHRAAAPFLAGLTGQPLTAGFPTTTAASLASLGTGLPTGRHGVTGYTSRLPELTEPINWLGWQGATSGSKLIDQLVPERVQPHPTVLERAESAGLNVSVVSAAMFEGSGLTRAVLRGGRYRPSLTAADTAVEVAEAAAAGGLIYCYNPDLDLIGHVRGCRSPHWPVQLRLIDRAVELLAERLPAGTQLLVTADHGMVDVPETAKIDFDADPQLAAGVSMIAGEARTRYLHVEPGCLDQVRRNWTERLGPDFAVLTRDEVVERGWYGPRVDPAVAERIGDLVVLALAGGAVVRRRTEPRLSALIGQHGALTEDELLVPLLRGSAE